MRWKYKVALSEDTRTSAKSLTDLGAAGWELVTVHRNENCHFAYLKKQTEGPEVVIKL